MLLKGNDVFVFPKMYRTLEKCLLRNSSKGFDLKLMELFKVNVHYCIPSITTDA